VVVNPRAGAGRAAALATATAEVARSRGDAVEVATPTDVAGVRAVVAAAVRAGTDRVVAVGGDGLVHQVVQDVAGTAVVLGIVACGTGNDYALGVGLDDAGTASPTMPALAAPVALDAVRTDHGWVASLATVGFSARVNERADAMRWPRGSSRYTLATLWSLPRLRAEPLVLTVDGTRHELEVTLLAVGTTAYFGGAMAICPEADLTDGRSDVTVIGACGRIELLRAFPRVFKGTHLTHPAVRTFSGVELELSAAVGAGPVGAARADGEALGPLPLRLTTVPGALHVAGARPPQARPGG